MRVFLTAPELATDTGKELLQLCIKIAENGELDLEEIKTLRRWLRANGENTSIASVPYLFDIMKRITADSVIDPDELLELQLAIERVIPTANRNAVVKARKDREAERKKRRRERQRIQRQRELEELKHTRAEELAQAMRLRHRFAKVAGVTFPNDDGVERQFIIARCREREQLTLQHDAYNQFSIVATKVLRQNGEQLGHAPEYLAEEIVDEVENGYMAFGVLTNLTGGTFDKPTRGVNFATFFVARDVPISEVNAYVNDVLAAGA